VTGVDVVREDRTWGDPEHVGQLVGLGLTQYEAKAYLGLIRRDSMTAAELSRLTGVPRQRIYDVLEGLVGKGLASVRPGETVRHTAVPPAVAVDRLVAAHRQRLAAVEKRGEQVVEALRPAYHEGRAHTNPLDYVEVLRDAHAIAARFDELVAGARSEVLILAKPPYASTEASPDRVSAAGRYTTRCVYELSAFEDPAFIAAVERFVAAGEDVRFVEELPLKLGIIDGTIVMVGMDDPVSGPAVLTTAVIEHPALARFLRTGFEAIWTGALGLGEARAAHARGARHPAGGD
jgi:HTH-type transcriptional regulator, sugar sensing transcriptional regulator